MRSSVSTRFCLAWIVPPLLVFSAASGKQVHYLLPMFPAFALLLARGLAVDAPPPSRWTRSPLVAVFLVGGGALLALPHVLSAARAPWAADIRFWGISAFVLAAGLVIAAPPRTQMETARWIAGASIVFMLLLHLTVIQDLSLRYDVRPTASEIVRIQDAGLPTAFMGKYRGEYHFVGRLSHPFDTLASGEVADWFRSHPQGYVLGLLSTWESAPPPIWRRPYRSDAVCLWDAASWNR
jgi:4-amino-4-deoxy-L-arabinose transferase-like glycosyltransferase